MTSTHIHIITSDESLAGVITRKVLEPARYQVTHTLNSADADDIFQNECPDLVLVLQKLDENPIEVIKHFRKQYPVLPIVVLGEDSVEQTFIVDALRSGAIDCLIPPMRTAKLLHAVRLGLDHKMRMESWAEEKAQERIDVLQKRVEELVTLAKVGLSVTSDLDLDRVLANVVKVGVELTGAEEGSLLLVDATTGDLYMHASFNFQEEFARTFRIPIQDTLAGQVISMGAPIILDSQTPKKIKTFYLVHALIYVPLEVHGRVIGVLGVDNREKQVPFASHHVTLLSSMADYAAIAIENAQLYAQTEVERNKLDAILSSVGDGVFVVDGDKCLVLANQNARQTFNLGEDASYVGKHISAIIKNREFANALKLDEEQSDSRVEFTLDAGRSFSAHISRALDVELIISLQDITHFKELDQLKSEFVRTVSHDLRSPLTAILGYVELIERVGEINNQQREFIRRVQVSVHNITSLVNDLLDLGRIEAGFDKRKESISVPAIIKYVVDGLRPNVQQKGQKIVLEIDDGLPHIYGTPTRLRQMLQNLIDNANKYTPSGGQITVRARAEGAQLVIEVADTGIGIPVEEQPYIFDKLYRASNIDSGLSGSGLGLAIVKSIVEDHQGRYWFDSEPGKGTTFTLVFPIVGEVAR